MRTAPDYIQFYPTLRCNRACDFCFNRSMPAMADMTHEAFRAMLDKLQALSVKTLDIIGGEPTLHPDIVRFVAEANDRGLSVNLSSNGTDSKLLEEIMKISKKVAVGVSINDRETLHELKDFVEKHHPAVKTVFRRSGNEALIADILALKPGRFYLIYRDAISRSELDATVPFPKYMDVAASRFRSQGAGMVYCSGFIPDAAYPELSNVRCPAGTTKLGVMPDGSVYPCNLFFGKAGFLLGNILNDPFEAIWNHQVLAFFRTYAKNACPQSSCPLHAKCHGGCPAQALLLSGDLAAPDPRCIATTAAGKNLV
jgi:radical SAM protein with 4Fe4S-binding SPASM domain